MKKISLYWQDKDLFNKYVEENKKPEESLLEARGRLLEELEKVE